MRVTLKRPGRKTLMLEHDAVGAVVIQPVRLSPGTDPSDAGPQPVCVSLPLVQRGYLRSLLATEVIERTPDGGIELLMFWLVEPNPDDG